MPAPDGSLWVTLFGTHKLGRIDVETGAMRERELSPPDARPRRLAVDSAGLIWYTDYARSALGSLNATSGRVREWHSPAPNSDPYGMAIGPDRRIWYCESAAGAMVGFEPRHGVP